MASEKITAIIDSVKAVSYTHLTLPRPTQSQSCPTAKACCPCLQVPSPALCLVWPLQCRLMPTSRKSPLLNCCVTAA